MGLLNFNFCAISGLPRSGSTLIAGIFNQHPDVHIEGTSGLGNLIGDTTKVIFDESSTAGLFLKANQRADYTNQKIVPAIMNGFYEDVDKPVVIDKSRAWHCPVLLNNVDKTIGDMINVLILVRPVEEIVKSFASVVAKEHRTDDFYNNLLTQSAPIKDCFYDVIKTVNSKRPNILVKSYSDVVDSPVTTIDEIRVFFGLPPFEYSFFNLSQYLPEDDSVYGAYKNLHSLRNGVSRKKINFEIPVWAHQKAVEMSNALYQFTDIGSEGNERGAFC